MLCTAERLTAGVWARHRFGTYAPTAYRMVEALHRRYCYGRPELVVRFTNGETCTTPTDATWEIEEATS